MEYEKCLVQVYEILNHLEDEELLKIPEKIIKNIEEKKDKDYIWRYDETKDLLNQEIDRKTVAILSYINTNYLLNEEEKVIVMQLHENNTEKLLSKIGSVNFNKPNVNESVKEIEKNDISKLLVEVDKTKWYEKIWKKLKKYLKYKM